MLLFFIFRFKVFFPSDVFLKFQTGRSQCACTPYYCSMICCHDIQFVSVTIITLWSHSWQSADYLMINDMYNQGFGTISFLSFWSLNRWVLRPNKRFGSSDLRISWIARIGWCFGSPSASYHRGLWVTRGQLRVLGFAALNIGSVSGLKYAFSKAPSTLRFSGPWWAGWGAAARPRDGRAAKFILLFLIFPWFWIIT